MATDEEITDEEDEEDDVEDCDEQYASLSKIKLNGGLLKTTNVKAISNGVGVHNLSSVNSANGESGSTHLNNKEIWLEYGCI